MWLLLQKKRKKAIRMCRDIGKPHHTLRNELCYHSLKQRPVIGNVTDIFVSLSVCLPFAVACGSAFPCKICEQKARQLELFQLVTGTDYFFYVRGLSTIP